MLFNLSTQNSIANHFLLEMRDKRIQTDRLRFRKNMERLGEIMAYEISKKMPYERSLAETPLGTSNINTIIQQPLLITILRAGIPFFQGFLNFFDHADAGFIGAYRQETSNNVSVKLDYAATPDLTNKQVILIDPMLATGKSIVDSLKVLLTKGVPSHIYIVALIAAPEGIKHIQDSVTVAHSLWTCAVDEKLNEQFYIVPGLGDAGDLSFGVKI